jgi:hypothetical protein
MRSRLHGKNLVQRLEADIDFLLVVRTAVIDCGVETAEKAMSAVDGFLQWFSVIPISDRIDHYIMMRGDVDRVWHAAILNTALYRQICTRYLGRFVHHESNLGCPRAGWVLETVDLLEKEFGTDLHPEFLAWRDLAIRESGIARLSAD